MFCAKASYLFLLAITLSQVRAAANDTCSDGWLFVDIHYRAVNGKHDAFSYGLFIGAGTSSQNQSLWPSVVSNETRLASNDFCADGSPSNCDDPKYTHGHFSPDVSSSWKTTSNSTSFDVAQLEDPVSSSTGTDRLNIFTHYFDPSPPSVLAINDYPINVISDYNSNGDVFFSSGSLGLGVSSTLLRRLLDIGRIKRNVVGMYLGTAYPRAGGVQNGSIVLGGYDAGRIEGDTHVYSLTDSPAAGISPLKVHVKQLSITTQDGTSIGLITDDGFDGYISTSQYEMEFPQSVTHSLSSALGGSAAPSPDDVLQLNKQFAGNMTMTLDDGYEITFPSEWISNASGLTPISASSMRSNTSAPGPYVFGAAFLHHLYMTIDYDASAFYLTNVKMSNNYVQPQELCTGAVPIAMSSPNVNKFTQSGMIGGIIGGVFAGLGAGWLLIFCIRKRLQHKQSQDRIRRMERGDIVPSKRSILRNRAKGALSLRGKRAKSVVFLPDAKRLSHDSDTLSAKGPSVEVVPTDDKEIQAGIELSSIRPQTSHNYNTQPPPYHTTQTRDSLPNPERFTNPYANSPLPTPMTAETPRTGNPLLGNFHQNYTQYDDNDDSDIYPEQCRDHKKGHQRVASDHLRAKLGLRVNIDPKTNSKGRRRPALAPVKVKYHAKTAEQATTGHKKSPSFRMLRKVFPAT